MLDYYPKKIVCLTDETTEMLYLATTPPKAMAKGANAPTIETEIPKMVNIPPPNTHTSSPSSQKKNKCYHSTPI